MRRLVFALLLFFPAAAFAGEVVKVTVQKSTLFEEPRFFSRVLAPVTYGDQMEVIEEMKGWSHVQFGRYRGWIHKSSLASVKMNLGKILGGASSAAPTDDEVALAGKGFTPEVERGYREDHPEINYALVDEIERYQVEDSALCRFMEQGGLRVKEAGQ